MTFHYLRYIVFFIILLYSITLSNNYKILIKTNQKDTLLITQAKLNDKEALITYLLHNNIIIDTSLNIKFYNDTILVLASNYFTYEIKNQENITHLFNQVLLNQNNGYPLVSYSLDSISYSYNSSKIIINPAYKLNQNKKYQIKAIEFFGLKSTRENTLYNIIDIYPNSNFIYNYILNIPKRLSKYSFLQLSNKPIILLDTNGNSYLKLYIDETKSTYFDGILGFTQTQNKKQELFGKFDISILNLFGTARKFFFYWNKPKQNFFDFSIEYTEPFIFNYDLSAHIKITQNKYDTLFINNSYNFGLEYYFNTDISFSYTLHYENSIPNVNLINSQYPKYFSNLHSFTFSVEKFNTQFPLKNNYFASLTLTTIQKSNKSVKKNFNQQSLLFNFQYLTQIFNNLYFYTNIISRNKTGNNITYNDLFSVGGFSSVRGYREIQFRGNLINYANNEIRLYTTNKSYFYILSDIGYVQIYRTELLKANTFLLSYGLGSVFSTKNGMFSVNISLPYNENFNNLKIHFGYINRF